MAEAIEEAYEDLFKLRRDAQEMDAAELRGKFKSLTQGQKSDTVINNMVATFSALCAQADWKKPKKTKPQAKKAEPPTIEGAALDTSDNTPQAQVEGLAEVGDKKSKLQLHYNIQLILPNSRDQAVFDALFSSLKKHLL